MGITKTELFTRDQNRTAQWAKVLGHPARIAILQYLLKQDTCVCGSLVEELFEAYGIEYTDTEVSEKFEGFQYISATLS